MIELAFAIVLGAAASAAKETCTCLEYPFVPNPPCFSECTKKLFSGAVSFDAVKNLDASVRANIESLRRHGAVISDFDHIKGETGLQALSIQFDAKDSRS